MQDQCADYVTQISELREAVDSLTVTGRCSPPVDAYRRAECLLLRFAGGERRKGGGADDAAAQRRNPRVQAGSTVVARVHVCGCASCRKGERALGEGGTITDRL